MITIGDPRLKVQPLNSLHHVIIPCITTFSSHFQLEECIWYNFTAYTVDREIFAENFLRARLIIATWPRGEKWIAQKRQHHYPAVTGWLRCRLSMASLRASIHSRQQTLFSPSCVWFRHHPGNICIYFFVFFRFFFFISF